MLYISGPNDTLKDLMLKEEFVGSLSEYDQKFASLNPELCKIFNYKQQLAPYTAMYLVSQPAFDSTTQAEICREINKFTLEERKALRMLQESGQDIPTQIAMTDIMSELQDYAAGFRKWLKNPLIVTPWTEINNSFTDKSLFKFFSEGSRFGSDYLRTSPRFYTLNTLYEDMMTRDVLNRQLHMLMNRKDSEAMSLKKELEKGIKQLTAKIKQLLPKQISTSRAKYVHRNFNYDEVRKMRSNSYSAKAARHGKLLTTNLDVLNKSGLARLKSLVNGLKVLGNSVNKALPILNYGVVAYDTALAYQNGKTREAARTFITGAAAIYLTTQAVAAVGGTTALGGFVVGAAMGDIALGATVLISSPVVGWVVVVVAGVAAAGYIGYKAKGVFEEVWDIAEPWGIAAYQQTCKAADLVHDELKAAWNSSSQWVLDFYNNK